MNIKSYKDLTVYQKSLDLVDFIYKISHQFPREEAFALTSQIRRAVVSIPSNIAEGNAKPFTKDFIKFLYIALGSANEVETQLTIALRQKYITQEIYDIAIDEQVQISKMVLSLIRSLNNKKID